MDLAVTAPARLRVVPATGTCLDCGEPVHLVPGACSECDGTPVYYHDSGAAQMACPGTSPHVRAIPVGGESLKAVA
jgi:hypothetical protein